MKSGFALSIIGLLGVAIVVAFGAEDSAIREAGETSYHYTFQIDSSYTPWSWTFPASDSILIPAAISDDGSTVVFASYYSDSSYESYHRDFYVFAAGTLALKIEEVHRINVNHGGDKVIVDPEPGWLYTDYDPYAPPPEDYCISLDGDTLWSGYILDCIATSELAWSSDDNCFAAFYGFGILDRMPFHYFNWSDISEDCCSGPFLRLFDSQGNGLDTLRFSRPAPENEFYFGSFKEDFSGFLGYLSFSLWPRRSPITDHDTVEVYRISDGSIDLITRFASPFVFPAWDPVGTPTCVHAKWAGFDNRIYMSWGWSNVNDPFDYEYAIQYYCLDTLGNVIWSDVDTSTMSGKLYSKSGRYLAEYDRLNENTPAGVIFRETATNEILFEKYYSDTHLNDVEIWEHEETGNALIMIPERNGPSKIFYPNGTRTDFNPLGIIPCFDYNFGYKVEGNTLTFYKVRW